MQHPQHAIPRNVDLLSASSHGNIIVDIVGISFVIRILLIRSHSIKRPDSIQMVSLQGPVSIAIMHGDDGMLLGIYPERVAIAAHRTLLRACRRLLLLVGISLDPQQNRVPKQQPAYQRIGHGALSDCRCVMSFLLCEATWLPLVIVWMVLLLSSHYSVIAWRWRVVLGMIIEIDAFSLSGEVDWSRIPRRHER